MPIIKKGEKVRSHIVSAIIHNVRRNQTSVLIHAVSTQNFGSLSFSGIKVLKKVNNQNHFGKSREKA